MKKNEIDIAINNECDAYLISGRENKIYLAQLNSDRGYVIVCKKQTYVIVDGRYFGLMKERNTKDVILLMDEKMTLQMHLDNIILAENLQRIGIEDSMTIANYEKLNVLINAELVICNFAHLRMIKNQKEISWIKKACEISDQAFQYILSFIKIGMSEQEVAIELDYQMQKLGSIKTAFDTIVLFGERGALPHGKPGETILRDGDFVTIDFGAKYHDYCSDMTRSFQVGKRENSKIEKIYDIVLAANKAAIAAARAGVSAKSIDAVARELISAQGYGEYFVHNLGHSIGLMGHEQPAFSPECDVILEEGMCLTIEPGIYLEGVGGIRIEDDIVITKEGCIVLTKSNKERMRIQG